jgi:putative ABC transport system substrate-binding protein
MPIVFLSHADPVASGHVASLGRPGGNATGLTIMMTETNVKGPELFKQAVPTLSRVSVIWDPATPSHTPGLKAAEAAGPLLGLRIQSVAVRSATEYESAFAGMARERAGGVLVLSTPLFIAGATPLAARALSASPADLFVERATRFELVINLRTARALGLSIPPSVLERAEELID